MNILFANEIGGVYGGAEQTVLDLALGLRSRGHQCDLAYGKAGRAVAEFATAFREMIPCAELGGRAAPPGASPLAAIVKETQADALFLHNVPDLPGDMAAVRPARTVRMVHDVGLFCPTGLGYFRHGRCACNYPAGWRCWLDLAFLARGDSQFMPVKYASVGGRLREMRRNMGLDALITVSDFMARRMADNGFDPDKIWVANPVRHLPALQPSPVPDTPEVLFVGALQRGKGVDLLFQALKRLTCPFKLSVVGEGKSRRQLARLCRDSGLDDKVVFHGWVDNAALGTHYERAKVIAIPTRAPESFCLVGPEAMHHGRPVVAFDVGGISSWLEHQETGILVREQDVAGFARALQRLLEDTPLARKMGEQGAKRVRERFVFARYLDEVEKVLAGGAVADCTKHVE